MESWSARNPLQGARARSTALTLRAFVSDTQEAHELTFFILVFTADFLLLLYRRARSAVRCRLREFCFANT